MSKTIFVHGLDDLSYAVELAEGFASANIKPWQRALKPGDCFIRFEDGIAVYCLILNDEDYDDEPDAEYRFTKSYSVMCDWGELGSAHISTADQKISRELFESFRKKGWPGDEDLVREMLRSN